tara:strand:+ start:1905 stop:2087 length:183 start_codon:yes stop_codon:yes gene_type:complete
MVINGGKRVLDNTTKRDAAEERQNKYNALSLEDKLRLIESRRGRSEKEKTKILNQMKENK